jgi:glycosyltransferase involved in cell wall biosynthesis
VIIWGCGTIDWRKGADIFIDTALKLQMNGVSNFVFCWIGQNFWDKEIAGWGAWQQWEELIAKNNLTETILFLGEKENPRDYFLAGDIFYLPSREDPFPLVCLEAADCGLPVVCFDEAGGMPGFVEEDAGNVVPFLNTNLAAKALEKLILNKNLREEKGSNARNKLRRRHAVDIAAPEILNICHTVMNSGPMVTVVVTLYNQEKFIAKRIDSILGQTFRDFELIILDDASTDRSFEIASGYLWHPSVKVIKNDLNSGSPFGQWKKGIEMAKGRFIWIAEGDDFSDPMFLETLLPAFNNQDVNLIYCASHTIDDQDEINSNYYQKNKYYSNLNYPADRWLKDYTAKGTDEIVNALSIRNTIPNISAVLWRISALRQINIDDCCRFKCTGDWFAYLLLLKSGSISYNASHLNYHRIHSSSISAKNKKSANDTIPDYFGIHKFVVQEFDIPDTIIKMMTDSVTKGLRTIWPDLSDAGFNTLYNETEIAAHDDF